MALRAFFITMVVLAAAATPALATDHMVGDADGWKLNFDYSKWAEGKDFRVGDTLMFMYKPGVHNVVKVNGPDFQRCSSSNASAVPFTSGNDMIPLSSPGKKWYICDIGDHCSNGMKLSITVSTVAEGPSSPAPTPGSSSAGELSSSKSSVWILAAMAAYRIIIMA